MSSSSLDHASVLASVCLELLVAAPDVPADVPTDAHLGQDLGVDPGLREEFLARLEYRFGVSIPDDDLEFRDSLEGIAAYLLERTSSADRRVR